MELIRGLHNIRQQHYGCVMTIGNFDGVHLGHRQVLAGLVNDAKSLGLPSTVMLFEPQPQEFFAKQNAPARLTLLREKLALLASAGVDRVVCVNFNADFANMDAEYFVSHIINQKLGVRALTVGDDFRFGHQRKGDFELLRHYAKKLDFTVKSTQSFHQHNCRVSSTEIRKALQLGDFTLAKTMLGHSYTMSGRVQHGWKKGRELGFPTANIATKRLVSPLKGVYAVNITLANNDTYFGVANIGVKPTFNGQHTLLEAHIFNFSHTIYGDKLVVEPVMKIRDEQKFDTFLALTEQIKQDVAKAKAYFGLN